jgi:hypothetical protein
MVDIHLKVSLEFKIRGLVHLLLKCDNFLPRKRLTTILAATYLTCNQVDGLQRQQLLFSLGLHNAMHSFVATDTTEPPSSSDDHGHEWQYCIGPNVNDQAVTICHI